MKVKEMIDAIADDLIIAYRDDGEPYTTHKDGSEFQDLYFTCHDGLLPNDFSYTMMYDIIHQMQDAKVESKSDLDDFYPEYGYLLPEDMPTLYAWVQSFYSREGYVNDYLCDAHPETIFDALQGGYMNEADEVLGYMKNWILEHSDDDEDED